MEMNKENNTPFKVEDVNWEELAGIGILKDELEMSGELDTLLKGEKTNVIRLSLVLLGVDVVMDATLQLVRKDGEQHQAERYHVRFLTAEQRIEFPGHFQLVLQDADGGQLVPVHVFRLERRVVFLVHFHVLIFLDSTFVSL